jgi:phosphoribosylformimino-5-aminoimidazole carboxamide ribotide isomerase
MEIIPAIDILNGKCVRLTKGDYSQSKTYSENPLEVALRFEGEGIKRLHLVDLDGAKAQHIVNHKVLEQVASKTGLAVDFGGGLKSDEDVRTAFEAGAQQITGGSVAIRDRALFLKWLSQYGPERIILGADAKHGHIAIQGWLQTTAVTIFDFLEDYTREGVQFAICTDVEKDGALSGPSTELYAGIRERWPSLQLIASGGVTTVDDLIALEELGVYGAIIGKALYEGTISLAQLRPFLA